VTAWYAGRILRKGEGPASILNIANIITAVRILLVPVFVIVFVADSHELGATRWVAALLFAVIIATDALDGHLARSRNLVSNVGIILDPIADKALTGAALIVLSAIGDLPPWVTIIILVREIGITVFRFAVLSKSVIPASRGGKLKTLMQSVAITLAIAPFPSLLGDWFVWVNIITMSIAFILTVLTGIDYLVQAWRKNRAVSV
jgi:CDP-diacylglycerol---glycerol-3-phosphate 3-phosphatidyltransferase